jgi:hypothetical protein
LKIVVMARQKARGKRQEARVKRVWEILRFFTQFGFIVFTYLFVLLNPRIAQKNKVHFVKSREIFKR